MAKAARKAFFPSRKFLLKDFSSSQIKTDSTTAGMKMPKVEKQMDPTKEMMGSKSGTRAATPTMAATINVLTIICERLCRWCGIFGASIFLQVMSMGTKNWRLKVKKTAKAIRIFTICAGLWGISQGDVTVPWKTFRRILIGASKNCDGTTRSVDPW